MRKIFSIIEQEEKVKEFIGYNNSKISFDWNNIKYNISTSNIESLIEIDKSINFEPQLECINTNKKQFFIPNDFIIVDEQISKLLKKNFEIQLFNSHEYFKKNDNIILKLNSKNIILLINIVFCSKYSSIPLE